MANEWISVKDRLPEYKVDVLICVSFVGRGSICRTVRTAVYGLRYKGMFSTRGFFGHNFSASFEAPISGNSGNVTHWQPLPAPPESEPTDGK